MKSFQSFIDYEGLPWIAAWSGWQDLNQRPPRPERGTLPN